MRRSCNLELELRLSSSDECSSSLESLHHQSCQDLQQQQLTIFYNGVMCTCDVTELQVAQSRSRRVKTALDVSRRRKGSQGGSRQPKVGQGSPLAGQDSPNETRLEAHSTAGFDCCKAFKGKICPSLFIHGSIVEGWSVLYVEEYLGRKRGVEIGAKKYYPKAVRKKARPRVRWECPPSGRLKINVDGAFCSDNGYGGIGVVVRDDFGIGIAAVVRPFLHAHSVLNMEAEACRVGLLLGIHQGWTNIDIESNSTILVVALKSEEEDLSEVTMNMEREAAESLIQVAGSEGSNPNSPDGSDLAFSEAVTRVKKLIFRRMLVGIKDGRFFLGTFHCIDKQGNIILQDSVEYRSTRRSSTSPTEQRCLGLILIPSSCRISCHVGCSVEEQLSLLSV
ncbi:hypothetical protein ACLB2K_024116 [Fragaria x ananassa]